MGNLLSSSRSKPNKSQPDPGPEKYEKTIVRALDPFMARNCSEMVCKFLVRFNGTLFNKPSFSFTFSKSQILHEFVIQYLDVEFRDENQFGTMFRLPTGPYHRMLVWKNMDIVAIMDKSDLCIIFLMQDHVEDNRHMWQFPKFEMINEKFRQKNFFLFNLEYIQSCTIPPEWQFRMN